MMLEDYDGWEVVDKDGEKIGVVERSYVDDGGKIRFVEVKLRGLRAKHRLVPVEDVERSDGGLTLPFSKSVVEKSPDASSEHDTLGEATLGDVRAYYQKTREDSNPAATEPVAAIPVHDAQSESDGQSTSTQQAHGAGGNVRGAVEQVREKLPGGNDAGRGDMGQVRDLGDVIEVPIVEEEIVKRPVVKEVLRIRKTSTSEQQMVDSDVHKENVDVQTEGDVRVRGNVEGTQQ